MPEMRFHVRWPDGSEESCYSPSTVITQYLEAGQQYTVSDFLERCTSALNEASDRVAQKYGYSCSSAMDQLQRIQHKAREFAGDLTQSVEVQRLS